MINLIIEICTFIAGGALGYIIGAVYATKIFCKMLGISKDCLLLLKKDLNDLVKRIKSSMPLDEETKEKFRKEIFDTFMKYSEYKSNNDICVTIAHED